MRTINDKWILIFVYPIMGITFVHIGNDNSLRELTKIPSYYTDILLALLITYVIGLYIRWLSRHIDKRFNWEAQLKSRIKYQLIWGLFVPTLFVVSAELIYLRLLQIKWDNSSIFYLELPVAMAFIMLINFAYFVLYFRLHNSDIKSALEAQVAQNESSQDKYLIAKQGNQNIQVSSSSIAYFVLKDKLTFLITEDNRQFLFDKTMKEVIDFLPTHQFYRLNRQLIAKRGSIVKCTPTKTRRLKIELNPPLSDDVFIPKAKVSQFMNWLNQS